MSVWTLRLRQDEWGGLATQKSCSWVVVAVVVVVLLLVLVLVLVLFSWGYRPASAAVTYLATHLGLEGFTGPSSAKRTRVTEFWGQEYINVRICTPLDSMQKQVESSKKSARLGCGQQGSRAAGPLQGRVFWSTSTSKLNTQVWQIGCALHASGLMPATLVASN